ncbi:MAG TPA: hypothetical protein VNT77_10725 [Allosphingosinicella sp.]|nr:hypothetical protein [Allosphingosinicella sp.]
MRKIMIAAAGVTALAASAAAQQPAPPARPDAPARTAPMDPRDEEIVRSIPDPREVEAVGAAAGRAMDAILDMPVGPLREAIEGRRLSRREREETLGDHAAKDDPYFRERMRDQLAVAGVAVGVLAEQMAVMTPVLRQTLEDVERRVEEAVRTPPPHDYGRGDPRQGDRRRN